MGHTILIHYLPQRTLWRTKKSQSFYLCCDFEIALYCFFLSNSKEKILTGINCVFSTQYLLPDYMIETKALNSTRDSSTPQSQVEVGDQISFFSLVMITQTLLPCFMKSFLSLLSMSDAKSKDMLLLPGIQSLKFVCIYRCRRSLWDSLSSQKATEALLLDPKKGSLHKSLWFGGVLVPPKRPLKEETIPNPSCSFFKFIAILSGKKCQGIFDPQHYETRSSRLQHAHIAMLTHLYKNSCKFIKQKLKQVLYMFLIFLFYISYMFVVSLLYICCMLIIWFLYTYIMFLRYLLQVSHMLGILPLCFFDHFPYRHVAWILVHFTTKKQIKKLLSLKSRMIKVNMGGRDTQKRGTGLAPDGAEKEGKEPMMFLLVSMLLKHRLIGYSTVLSHYYHATRNHAYYDNK
ncbi:hypothetical protein VP01_2397g2 [Puccinia sorghi]|uniref:Uncharacterized protein n=1 Tax=Puccinia sorghi TaxID=27349 RepID=A0A0L6V6T9_9BASI|nr:hypothetical protein VP01_2397g2 [Puccinia sorghi]